MDLTQIGSVPLRMVAQRLRKVGKLAGHTPESVACVAKAASCRTDPATVHGHISGRQIAVVDSAACVALIEKAIGAGRVSRETVEGVARWAVAKRGGAVETAPEATQGPCGDCSHAKASHSDTGYCGMTGCDCTRYTQETTPESVARTCPTCGKEVAILKYDACAECRAKREGAEMEAAEVEIESEIPAPALVNGEAFEAFRRGLEGMVRGIVPAAAPLDESKVREIVAKAISETGALRVEIVRSNGEIKAVEGRTHKLFPILVKMIAASDNANRKLIAPFLVGPAGSGKTQACHQAAEALGLRFFSQSVCSQTTASTLMGYYDANGKYVRSLFREAYENGGLYLLDEIDAGNPNVLAVLNSALSNGVCAFPDGMIPRHADFRCCAAGNTYGSGRTVEYVGRNPIDAATGNRFVKLAWPYDEKLERDFCPMPEWAIYVQKWRAALARRGVKHILSPRQSLDGALLLSAGMDADTVINTVLTSGLDESTANAIRSEVGGFNA